MPSRLRRRVTRVALSVIASVAEDARTHAAPLMLDFLWKGEPLGRANTTT